jgi:hypothetical protein
VAGWREEVLMSAAEIDGRKLPAYWRESDARYALERWKASGLSLAEFARRHEIHVQRLRRWSKDLEVPAPRFVKLVVREPKTPSAFRVHVGRAVIEVPADFDTDAFERLVEVLAC